MAPNRVEEIKKEGREKLCKKMNCKGEKHGIEGITILAGCDRLWERKSRQARGEPGDDQGHLECGVECKEEKNAEIIKFRVHQYTENPTMKLSGEEIQTVMGCDNCGLGVTECLLVDCEECGTSWVREDYALSVIGNDVICLFPSLDSVNTGKIVREEVEKSTIKIE